MTNAAFRAFCVTAAVLFGSPTSASETQLPVSAMSKTISYRGGVVSFSIPRAWQEEYEPSGGATFYEDRPDSGTLRLNVLSFESKDKPAQQMALTAFPAGSFELIGNGLPLRKRLEETIENKELLHIHHWDIAVPVPPQSLRLVLFSYTILASQEPKTETKAELALINQSIRAATFSQEAGVAGDYQHE